MGNHVYRLHYITPSGKVRHRRYKGKEGFEAAAKMLMPLCGPAISVARKCPARVLRSLGKGNVPAS